jgi:hypothetical protein
LKIATTKVGKVNANMQQRLIAKMSYSDETGFCLSAPLQRRYVSHIYDVLTKSTYKIFLGVVSSHISITESEIYLT